MSAEPEERRESDELRVAYRRRTALLWVVVLGAPGQRPEARSTGSCTSCSGAQSCSPSSESG